MALASPKCILVEFLNFCTILVLLFHPSSLNSVRRIQTKQLKQLLIQIQGYTPTEVILALQLGKFHFPPQNDDYVAVSVRATPGYIGCYQRILSVAHLIRSEHLEKFEPFAHADRVHHMYVFVQYVYFYYWNLYIWYIQIASINHYINVLLQAALWLFRTCIYWNQFLERYKYLCFD